MPDTRPCRCRCCGSEARAARRRAARSGLRALGAPAVYAGATALGRMQQMRDDPELVAFGLQDADEDVRMEAQLLSRGRSLEAFSHDELVRLVRRGELDASRLDDVVSEARRRNDAWLMLAICQQPQASASALMAGERSGLPATRAAALVQMHQRGLRTAEQAACAGTVRERVAFARVAPVEVLPLMVRDPSVRVRREAAAHVMDADAVRWLAGDDDAHVRRALLWGWAEPALVLSHLGHDPDPELRAEARARGRELHGAGLLDGLFDWLWDTDDGADISADSSLAGV